MAKLEKIREDLEFKLHKDDAIERVKFEDFIKGYFVSGKRINVRHGDIKGVTIVDLIGDVQPNNGDKDVKKLVLVPYSSNSDHLATDGTMNGDRDRNSVDTVAVEIYGIYEKHVFVIQLTDKNETIVQSLPSDATERSLLWDLMYNFKDSNEYDCVLSRLSSRVADIIFGININPMQSHIIYNGDNVILSITHSVEALHKFYPSGTYRPTMDTGCHYFRSKAEHLIFNGPVTSEKSDLKDAKTEINPSERVTTLANGKYAHLEMIEEYELYGRYRLVGVEAYMGCAFADYEKFTSDCVPSAIYNDMSWMDVDNSEFTPLHGITRVDLSKSFDTYRSVFCIPYSDSYCVLVGLYRGLINSEAKYTPVILSYKDSVFISCYGVDVTKPNEVLKRLGAFKDKNGVSVPVIENEPNTHRDIGNDDVAMLFNHYIRGARVEDRIKHLGAAILPVPYDTDVEHVKIVTPGVGTLAHEKSVHALAETIIANEKSEHTDLNQDKGGVSNDVVDALNRIGDIGDPDKFLRYTIEETYANSETYSDSDNVPALRYIRFVSNMSLDKTFLNRLSTYIVTDNAPKFLPHTISAIDATGLLMLFIPLNGGRVVIIKAHPAINVADEVNRPSFNLTEYCNVMCDEVSHYVNTDAIRATSKVVNDIIKNRLNDMIEVKVLTDGDFLGFYPFDITSFVECCINEIAFKAYASILPSDAPYFNPNKWTDTKDISTTVELAFDTHGILEEVEISNNHGNQSHDIQVVNDESTYKCHGVIIKGAPTLKEVYGTKTKTDKEGANLRW